MKRFYLIIFSMSLLTLISLFAQTERSSEYIKKPLPKTSEKVWQTNLLRNKADLIPGITEKEKYLCSNKPSLRYEYFVSNEARRLRIKEKVLSGFLGLFETLAGGGITLSFAGYLAMGLPDLKGFPPTWMTGVSGTAISISGFIGMFAIYIPRIVRLRRARKEYEAYKKRMNLTNVYIRHYKLLEMREGEIKEGASFGSGEKE